jgi:hypothetical protein
MSGKGTGEALRVGRGTRGLLRAKNERVRLGAVVAVYEWRVKMVEQDDLTAEVAEPRAIVEDRKARDREERPPEPRQNGVHHR